MQPIKAISNLEESVIVVENKTFGTILLHKASD